MEFPQAQVDALTWITPRPELLFTRGEGSWLTDHTGKRYLDFVQGWAVTCLGHCPPQIRQALGAQADALTNPSPAFSNAPSLNWRPRSPAIRASTGCSSPTPAPRPTGAPSSSPASSGGCTGAGPAADVDEVQTGMGRTGRRFAHQHAGIEPDIMTLGKGIGGGVPLAALLAREAVCCFEAGDQGGTYNGNPLMAAVGVAVLETLLAPGFLTQVAETGDYLAARLAELARRHGLPGERGSGLLRALILADQRGPALVEAARGLAPTAPLLNAPRPNLLRFMPALNVSRAEIDLMSEQLDGLLAAA